MKQIKRLLACAVSFALFATSFAISAVESAGTVDITNPDGVVVAIEPITKTGPVQFAETIADLTQNDSNYYPLGTTGVKVSQDELKNGGMVVTAGVYVYDKVNAGYDSYTSTYLSSVRAAFYPSNPSIGISFPSYDMASDSRLYGHALDNPGSDVTQFSLDSHMGYVANPTIIDNGVVQSKDPDNYYESPQPEASVMWYYMATGDDTVTGNNLPQYLGNDNQKGNGSAVATLTDKKNCFLSTFNIELPQDLAAGTYTIGFDPNVSYVSVLDSSSSHTIENEWRGMSIEVTPGTGGTGNYDKLTIELGEATTPEAVQTMQGTQYVTKIPVKVYGDTVFVDGIGLGFNISQPIFEFEKVYDKVTASHIATAGNQVMFEIDNGQTYDPDTKITTPANITIPDGQILGYLKAYVPTADTKISISIDTTFEVYGVTAGASQPYENFDVVSQNPTVAKELLRPSNRGDVNCDGQLTTADISNMLTIWKLSADTNPTEYQGYLDSLNANYTVAQSIANADVYEDLGDRVINVSDITALLSNIFAGKDFPATVNDDLYV